MTGSSSTSPSPEAAANLRAIPAGVRVRGRVTPPASKSVTHRCLNLALLAGCPLVVERPLLAEDTRLFLVALERCGFQVELTDEAGDEPVVRLTPGAEPPRGGEIFCGNAGTMYRFLVATLAVLPGEWLLDGTPRLRERPVGPLIDALTALGARIRCPRQAGYGPLEISGGHLGGGRTAIDAGQSSQFLSALLMAGLRAPAAVTVEIRSLTSSPYLDLTLDAVAAFGGRIEQPEPGCFRVQPGPLAASRLRVEGDLSAACYPAAAAALTGGTVEIAGVRQDTHQGDRAFFDLLVRMGASVRWHAAGVEVRGDGELRGVTADLASMPDQVPTLAALAPFARGTTRILNVPHLRIKESDRLAAMARELSRLGAQVEELPDGLVIEGTWSEGLPGELPAVAVDTYDDHRIAMSLALVGLRRGGVSVRHPEVVAKSYPDFWRHLGEICAP